MTPSKRDRVFSADGHLCRAAISKTYQESFLLRAANNLFQGSQDSLRGAYNLFRESQNSLLLEAYKPTMGQKSTVLGRQKLA